MLVGDNVIIDNNATGVGLGIFVGGTANSSVSVVGNSISGIDENHGIYVWQTGTGDVWGMGNTIDMTGDVGLWVDETGGSVTLSGNSANNTGEDGLLVTDTTGGVRVDGNFVGNSGSIGLDSTIADAIQILNTGGNVTVDDNTIAAGAAVDRDGVRIVGTAGNVSVSTPASAPAAISTPAMASISGTPAWPFLSSRTWSSTPATTVLRSSMSA